MFSSGSSCSIPPEGMADQYIVIRLVLFWACLCEQGSLLLGSPDSFIMVDLFLYMPDEG
jgi:hypothetical protein